MTGRASTKVKRRYAPTRPGNGRTTSIWIHPEEDRYINKVAKQRRITRNAAIIAIIAEHRANGSA